MHLPQRWMLRALHPAASLDIREASSTLIPAVTAWAMSRMLYGDVMEIRLRAHAVPLIVARLRAGGHRVLQIGAVACPSEWRIWAQKGGLAAWPGRR